MARHPGLAHAEHGDDFTHGKLVARQNAHEAQARCVGQGLEPGQGIVCVVLHIKIS